MPTPRPSPLPTQNPTPQPSAPPSASPTSFPTVGETQSYAELQSRIAELEDIIQQMEDAGCTV